MGASEKTVMVTGASGFIGRRCVPLLAAKGYRVHAISSRAGRTSSDPLVSWHRYDLLDPDACAQAVARLRPSHLLHLAWIAVPGAFWLSPLNLKWLASGVALMDAFYAQGGRHALGVGSCAEYEWGSDDYREEATPTKPDTIYGKCKLALALATAAAAAARGGTAAWGRLFFPYGPGEPAERLVPSVICGLLRRERVDCTLGTQVRDFIYVDDAAMALVSLLDSGVAGSFNIGTGIGVSLAQMIDAITARLGGAELVRLGARQRPPTDPDRVVADTAKLRELGWRPSVDLQEGIERSIAAWRALVEKGAACES